MFSLTDVDTHLLLFSGFVHYNPLISGVMVHQLTQLEQPRLIICYPSLASLRLRLEPQKSYNLIVDEVCNARFMAVSKDILSISKIISCDEQLTRLVKAAKHVLVTQDRVTKNAVNWICNRVGVDSESGQIDGQVHVIALSNQRFWTGRHFVFTSNERVAFGWLRDIVLSGYSSTGQPHSHPTAVAVNYAGKGEGIVMWLRSEVGEMMSAAGATADTILAVQRRIVLVSMELNKDPNSIGARMMRNPNGVATECDVLVYTYAMNVGISFTLHFKVMFGWFHPLIGTLEDVIQAMSRVRDQTPDLWPYSFMFLDNSCADLVSDVGYYLTVANIELPGCNDGLLLAYAEQKAMEAKFRNGVARAVTKRFECLSAASAYAPPLLHSDQQGSQIPTPSPCFPDPSSSAYIFRNKGTSECFDNVTEVSGSDDASLLVLLADPRRVLPPLSGVNAHITLARASAMTAVFAQYNSNGNLASLVRVAPELLTQSPITAGVRLKAMSDVLVPLIYLQCHNCGEPRGSAGWGFLTIPEKRLTLYIDHMLRVGLECPVSEPIPRKGGALDLYDLQPPATGVGMHGKNQAMMEVFSSSNEAYSCALPKSPDNIMHFGGSALWSSFCQHSPPMDTGSVGGAGLKPAFRAFLSASGLHLLYGVEKEDAAEDAAGAPASSQNGHRAALVIDEISFTKLLAVLFYIRPHTPMPNLAWERCWAAGKLLVA